MSSLRAPALLLVSLVIACGGKPPAGGDDGPGTSDTTPPDIVGVEAVSHTEIDVVFSEGLAVETVVPTAFHVQGGDAAVDVQAAAPRGDGLSVALTVGPTMHHGQTYTLLVEGVSDVAGNAIGGATRQFSGRGAVAAVLGGVPPERTSVTHAAVTVSGDDIVAYQFEVTSPDGPGGWSAETPATTPVTLDAMVDGTYQLAVVGKDSQGNWQKFADATTATWTVDTVPPTAVLTTMPASVTPERDATFVVGGSDVVAYRARVDGGVWGAESDVTTPLSLSGLAEGSHTVDVVGRDLAGNWQADTAATSVTWTVDLTPPVATLAQLPGDPTRTTTLDVTVAGTDVVGYRFAVDGGAFGPETPVATPITATGLGEGQHTLAVVGRDTAGNWQRDSGATTYGWTVDLTPPVASLASLPADPTSQRSTAVSVGGDGVVSYRYQLDSSPWSGRIAVTQLLAVQGLAEGAHTLAVVGVDAAGNEDLLHPVTYGWTIDLTAPTAAVSVVTPAATPTAVTDLDTVVGGADVVAYEARLDGGPWSAETSVATHFTATGLGEGGHTLEIIGRDLAGNWQGVTTPASFTWSIDLTPPVVTLGNLPAPLTNQTSASISVGGADVVGYAFRVDGGGYRAEQPVGTAIDLPVLPEGAHTVEVVGRDAVGNWQATPTTYTWTVDLTAPTADFAGVPSNPSNDPAPTITVVGDGIVAYSYQLDGGAWSGFTDVSSPIVLSGLTEGGHTLAVVGEDGAGNVQDVANAKQYDWTVDLTPPVVTLAGAPADPSNSTTASISVGPGDVVAYSYRLDGGGWGPITDVSSPIQLSGLAEGSHTLAVLGVDRAGNWQAEASATTHTWVVDVTPPDPAAVDDLAGSVDGLGAFERGLSVTFSWLPPADAADVEIEVATDDAFGNVVYGPSSLGATSSYVYVVDPADGPRYYARVRVRDAAGNSSDYGTASDGIDVAGDVSGSVEDSNHAIVAGAEVRLERTSDGALVATTTTDASGGFGFANVAIGSNSYQLAVASTGYTSATKYNVTVAAGSDTNVGVIYLVPTGASAGSISGSVVDANDGANVAGATVTVYDWTGAAVDVQTSSSTATFTTASLPPGTYTLVITNLGYFDLTVDNIVVDGNQNVDRQALCPILTEPHVRVVLLWGRNPQDLDLHVVGPSSQIVSDTDGPTDRFHVYWDRKKSFDENTGGYRSAADPSGTSSTTSLVQDDTTSYGPEAINLFGYGNGYAHGIYTFTVHDYSQTDWYAAPVTMRIYDAQGMVREIPLPTGAGRNVYYWQAFKLDVQGITRADRTLTVVNTFAKLTWSSKSSMNW